MRDFQNAYPNDRYTKFDKEYACWANNHNGWRKAKKKWRKIGKKRTRREEEEKIVRARQSLKRRKQKERRAQRHGEVLIDVFADSINEAKARRKRYKE